MLPIKSRPQSLAAYVSVPKPRARILAWWRPSSGYNLYVCGNGGTKPRHADLLAADIDESTAITYIDRFLMYYIMTADRLTRTAVWLEKLEGGIEHLKEVIISDKLGLCTELEERIQFLVDTYTANGPRW